MTTGYTNRVADGLVADLKVWVKEIAPSLGYRVEVSDSNVKWERDQLEQAEKALGELETLDADKEAAEDYREKVEHWQNCESTRLRVNQNIISMIRQVEAWSAPEPLKELKAFLLRQLTESIEENTLKFPKRGTDLEWAAEQRGYRSKRVDRARADVRTAEAKYEKAVQRAKALEDFLK